MSYQIRDRSDGMFELVFDKPVLVGIFPERDGAEKYCAFLNDQDPELPEDQPASFGQALKDIAEAVSDLDEIPPPVRNSSRPANLPAVVLDKPKAPAQIRDDSAAGMSDEETAKAFARIQQGEKVFDVARDFGVSGNSLRAKWAKHKRDLQKHMAEAGQQPCRLCKRPFTPSISNPDTCARCSK